MFTRKDLMRILLPLLLEQLLSVTVGLFDSVMVSSAGEAAVSGVSLVVPVNLLLNIVFTALATGGAVVCSQLLGQKDHKAAKDAAKQLYYLTFLLSVLIMLFTLVFRKPLLSLFFGKVESDVMICAERYFFITALSYPFVALSGSGAAIFRAAGNTKVTLYIAIGTNCVNIIGNAVLIYGLGLGAEGAAIATLVSVALGATVNTLLCCNPKFSVCIEEPFRYRPHFPMIRKILYIGVPSGVENGMYQFGKLITQSFVSSLGTTAIAANVAGQQLSSLVDALGHAVGLCVVTVVGRCIGAGEGKQAKKYAKSLLGTGYAVLAVMSVLLSLLAKPLIDLYGISAQASMLARNLILIYSAMTIVFWPLSFIIPYVFRAASDVRYTTTVSMLSMWFCRVALSYIFVLRFDLGLSGVWYAMFADWIVRTVFFVARFFGDKWLEKYKSD